VLLTCNDIFVLMILMLKWCVLLLFTALSGPHGQASFTSDPAHCWAWSEEATPTTGMSHCVCVCQCTLAHHSSKVKIQTPEGQQKEDVQSVCSSAVVWRDIRLCDNDCRSFCVSMQLEREEGGIWNASPKNKLMIATHSTVTQSYMTCTVLENHLSTKIRLKPKHWFKKHATLHGCVCRTRSMGIFFK